MSEPPAPEGLALWSFATPSANERISPRSVVVTRPKSKEIIMKNLITAVALTAGVLAFGATSASAAIVCNEQGDCWKTKEKYAYPPDARVRIYADDWKWGPNDKYRWREHEGRGYWGPNGVWLEF